jgi:UDP-galactopyranose mutase
VRYNYNNRYFSDSFEGLPLNGYAHLFQQMVKNPLIKIHLETDYLQVLKDLPTNSITIYSGAIDEYFNYEFGLLNWRTLDFKYETVSVPDFQGTSVVNYPDLDVPFTRIHEFRHLHPERSYESPKSLIAMEYSRWATVEDEPYYPVNTKEDREKLNLYRELVKNEKNIFFGGRLGSYQYLDMHMAVASALALFKNQLKPRLLV